MHGQVRQALMVIPLRWWRLVEVDGRCLFDYYDDPGGWLRWPEARVSGKCVNQFFDV